MRITDTMDSHARAIPDKAAIVSENEVVDYGSLSRMINRVANALLGCKRLQSEAKMDQGPERQRKVAILLHHRAEFLQVFLGAAMAGWIAVPFDPKWSPVEMEETLLSCTPDVLVVDEDYTGRFRAIPAHVQTVIYREAGGRPLPLNATDFASWLSRSGGDRPEVSDVSGQAACYMGFTSGTTGRPKGFIRSHSSWVKSFKASEIEFGINAADHILVPGPLVHSHFLYAAVHGLYTGATVYLQDKFSAAKMLSCMEQFPVSVVYMVPTMFEALFKAVEDTQEPLPVNCVRALISSGAKWGTQSKHKITNFFPAADLYEFYGASELSFVTVLDPEGNRRKPDSVGRPVHGVDISIRNRDGGEAAVGEVGKLYVRSEYVFMGYYRNPGETRHVLGENGWATVHDMAWRDEDGYVYIAGREKNMMICGGLNIYPEEVERVILQLPEIEEAVVVGVPDQYWGEKIVALVRAKSGMTIRKNVIKTHCRAHLAGYKCPRKVVEVDAFPYTTSGKIARERVKAFLLNRDGTGAADA